MEGSVDSIQRIYFIGIAGSGMSALAQYLSGIGKAVSGSDRYFSGSSPHDIRDKLEAAGIRCFPQDGTGITAALDLVVVSTAVEDQVAEVQKARSLNIPVIKRSELLAWIANSRKTIAVGGTSGKSTTAAMIYEILQVAGLSPSIITGAGLVSIMHQGKIGNAAVGRGEWLVIEADESDGSIVEYRPAIGLLLNIDKDHKEVDELKALFEIFRSNSETFIVNRGHALARTYSNGETCDFSAEAENASCLTATDFIQQGLSISFQVRGISFQLNALGRHNMENALAAVAVALQTGVSLEQSAAALRHYEGIYRRHQVLGKHKHIWLIDDFAHNPAKCAASIRACQPIASKVVAWFQPHGYGPTRFLRKEFVEEIAQALRPQDEIWMSEIYYAGGTAVKDISARDLIEDLQKSGARAYFIENRSDLLDALRPHLTDAGVLLLMGARDPSLETFAKTVWEQLKQD